MLFRSRRWALCEATKHGPTAKACELRSRPASAVSGSGRRQLAPGLFDIHAVEPQQVLAEDTRARDRGRLHDRNVDGGDGRAVPPGERNAIAAAEADKTGTTTLGKRVVDHSFQVPLQICWVVTALVGILIVCALLR